MFSHSTGPSAPTNVEGINCVIVVWQVPDSPRGRITGYRITFSRGTSESTVTKQPNENFHRISEGDLPEGTGEVTVKVSDYIMIIQGTGM